MAGGTVSVNRIIPQTPFLYSKNKKNIMAYYGDGGNRYADSSSFRHGGDYRGGGGGDRGNGSSRFASDGLGANLRTIHWDLSKLPVFEKNFYIEHPAVRARSDGDAEHWRREHHITVIGRGVPKVC